MNPSIEDEIDVSSSNEDLNFVENSQIIYDTEVFSKSNPCWTYWYHKSVNSKFSFDYCYKLRTPLTSLPDDVLEVCNRVYYADGDFKLTPERGVIRYGSCWIYIGMYDYEVISKEKLYKHLQLKLAADSSEDIKETLSIIFERFPYDSSPTPKNFIPKTSIYFCKLKKDNGGVDFTQKYAKTPPWLSIRNNYPQSVKKQIDNLFSGDDIDLKKGKLIIWSGSPGTGKTYVLRSLAHHLQRKNRVFYITDIENFFDSSDYLLKLDNIGQGHADAWDKNLFIILEDAGEFLAKNAKDRIGQGFSRLLNMADGILGEAYKAMFIITTNERLDDLHPAVTRSGRAVSIINFPLFTENEANNWLEAHKCDKLAKTPMSLADLYAIVRKDQDTPPIRTKPIGFTANLENLSSNGSGKEGESVLNSSI